MNKEAMTIQSKQCARFLLVFFICVTGIAAILLGKDVNWDLKNYHFYNGYAFLNGRMGYDIAPAQIQTYLNPLYDLFVFLGISYLPPMLFGFLVGAIQGINIYLIYLLAQITLTGYSAKVTCTVGIVASATAFSGAAWFSEIGNTMGDSIISLFVLAAVYLVFSSSVPISVKTCKTNLVAAGLLLGIGTGLKLVVAVYVVAFFAALLVLSDVRSVLKIYICVSLSFLIGMAASLGYWMLHLWQLYRSPLFPFYNKLFHSPYYELSNFTDNRFLPKTLLQKLFYPFYFATNGNLVSEQTFTDYRFIVLYAAVLIFAIFTIYYKIYSKLRIRESKSHSKQLFIIIFSIVSYVLWQSLFSIYRYAIIIELLIPIVVIAVCFIVVDNEKVRLALLMMVFLFLIISVRPMNHGRQAWSHEYLNVFDKAQLACFDNATILISDFTPSSYIIPSFPAHTRFVRIVGNFFTLGNKTLIAKDVEGAIRSAEQLKVLMPNDIHGQRLLAQSGIQINKEKCVAIQTSIGDVFHICNADSPL